VLLEDKWIDDWSAHRRASWGLVRSFQGLELFAEMTVLENLQVPQDTVGGWRTATELIRPARTVLPPVTRAAVQDFGLAPILHKSPTTRSPTDSGDWWRSPARSRRSRRYCCSMSPSLA
jgi:sulfate-transporting ATPase